MPVASDRRVARPAATLRAAGLGRRVLGVVDFPGSGRWAAASLINAVGTGLLLPLSVLYFTLHIGLSAASVGLGLTIGGVIALAFVPVGGVLVDALGSKSVLLASWGLAAAAYAGYGAVANWPGFLVVATAAEIAAAMGSTAGKALVTELAAGRDRVRLLASQQSLGNLGYGLGGLLATAALAIGGARLSVRRLRQRAQLRDRGPARPRPVRARPATGPGIKTMTPREVCGWYSPIGAT